MTRSAPSQPGMPRRNPAGRELGGSDAPGV